MVYYITRANEALTKKKKLKTKKIKKHLKLCLKYDILNKQRNETVP